MQEQRGDAVAVHPGTAKVLVHTYSNRRAATRHLRCCQTLRSAIASTNTAGPDGVKSSSLICFQIRLNKPHQLGRKRRPRWLGLSHEINRKQLRLLPASCAVSAEIWSAFLILANRRFVQSASKFIFEEGSPLNFFFCRVPWICEILHLVYLDTVNRLKRNLIKFC